MNELAAPGAMPSESIGKFLLVLSSAVLWRQKPFLRHSLPPLGAEAKTTPRIPCRFPGSCGSTSWTDKSESVLEGNGPMTQEASPVALGDEADGELLTRYQRLDDQAAFAEIDRRYHRQLVGYVGRFRGGVLRTAAEDIVQDAFLEFHKNRKKYAPRNIRSLLYSIVTNRCGDYVKAAEGKTRDHRLTRPLLESQADPKADPDKHLSQMEVDDVLSTLKPEQAEAVRLTRIDGHSNESAAELLGTSPTAVRGRVERGITALRQVAAGGCDPAVL